MIQFIKTIQIALNMKLNITNGTDRPAYINCSLELIVQTNMRHIKDKTHNENKSTVLLQSFLHSVCIVW